MNGALPEAVRDVALLVARVVLGVVLFAHGWQKVVIYGVAETRDQFEALGIPAAIASSSFVAFVEFVGGVLLVLGALTPLVVGLHLVVMIGAAAFVHVSNGIFAADGGWELVGVIAAAELVLAACGAGRFSVDRLIVVRLRRGPAIAPPGAEPVTASAGGRHEKLDTADAEPVTSAFPVVTGANFAVQPDAPMFGELPPTSALPEQTGRPRRIPRPITPLQSRADAPRRSDPRQLDRSDDTTG
ncbi:DoxX family protein [Pseudonocardia humida]|uniref:DoxX family protein n=1 Tax=Pseudonocardia humida TaxID=2800819 RepID=A0ABT1A1K1_9PSEU|nr:DoxX family protein [Pseudonocardia humida]MCO1656872.1 DoxX family protein [Pseudonocardia humida]